LAFRPLPGRPASAFWGFVPSSRPQSAAALLWVPMPHIRVFPESPRLGPALSGFPSSAFRTPSTAFSATDLASFFHPAIAFRVSPSGVCPSIRVRSGFLRTFPLVPLSTRACGFPRQLACPRLQGFAPRFECGDQRDGLDHARSAPLLEFALFGSLPFRSWHSLSGCLRLQPSPR
jgi:hypothetical protein